MAPRTSGRGRHTKPGGIEASEMAEEEKSSKSFQNISISSSINSITLTLIKLDQSSKAHYGVVKAVEN